MRAPALCATMGPMRSCATCGAALQKEASFCPACGTKVPAESAPTAQHASIRIQEGVVDPLASTAAGPSPAAGMKRQDAMSPAEVLLSPLAETAVPSSSSKPKQPAPAQGEAKQAAPAVQPRKTRGRTVPLSAVRPPLGAPQPGFAPPPQARAPQPFAGAPPLQPAPAPPQGAAPPPPAWQPGARVLVQWANGQKYPGVVQRVSGPTCLVRFDAGEQRWVETRYVLPAT